MKKKKSLSQKTEKFNLPTEAIVNMTNDAFAELLRNAKCIANLHQRTETIERLMMQREGITEETDPKKKRQLAKRIVEKAFAIIEKSSHSPNN